MPVTSGPQITINQIHLEAGGTSGTQASLNDADIRDLIDKASGAQMAMSEWYGATKTLYVLQGRTAADDIFSSYYGPSYGDRLPGLNGGNVDTYSYEGNVGGSSDFLELSVRLDEFGDEWFTLTYASGISGKLSGATSMQLSTTSGTVLRTFVPVDNVLMNNDSIVGLSSPMGTSGEYQTLIGTDLVITIT
jgi:hypothetical protein